MRHKRSFAILIAALLLLVTLSFGFIGASANHEHFSEAECPICTELEVRKKTLEELGGALPVVLSALLAAVAFLPAVFCGPISPKRESSTLVSLKVKLTN